MNAARSAKRGIRPAVLVWLAAALAILLSAYTLFALKQTRQTLERSVRRSAEALAESLALAVRNVTNAGAAIDELWLARWREAAEKLAAQRSAPEIPFEWLYEFDSPRIDWADIEGHIIASTDPGAGNLLPVSLLTDSAWMAIRDGALYSRFDRPSGSTAAVVRAGDRSLILWGATERLSAFQIDIGAGYLIRNLSELPDLEYIVLQGGEGIVLASRRVEEMSRIADDSALSVLMREGGVISREWDFSDELIIEAAARVPDQMRILRLGVSRTSLEALDRSITLQLSLLAGLLFLIGLGGLAFFWTTQRYTSLAEDLSAAEALTDELFRGIRSALIVIDRDGVIRLANPQAGYLLGQPAGALTGRSYADVAPGDPARFQPLREKGEATLEKEVSWRNSNGEERVLLVSTTRLRGDREDAVAILHDITETRKLAQQSEQHERLAAMGDLAAGVAHEIRNPLNAISIASQRLNTEFSPSENTEEYRQLLGHLKVEIGRLNETVQQFLGLARGLKLEQKEVNLKDLIESVARTLKLESREKGVSVATEVSALPHISGDDDALRKVFLNLGQNALAATDQGGQITFKAGVLGDRIAVRVQDTGSGIDPADLPNIFRPYFTRKRGGSGIGLALAHRIVSGHGGHISVESHPGSGSTFTVSLPVAPGRVS
jgi:PAS domain S-box-containing protein